MKALQALHDRYVARAARVFPHSYRAFVYYMECAEALEMLMLDKGVA